MIGVDELLDLLLGEVQPLPATSVRINDAVGSALAQPLVAVDPIPPFANSAMDGYAIRREDLATVDRFELVAHVPAGTAFDRRLMPGQTAAIATGGALPSGADAVVPIEQSERDGDRVRLAGPLPGHGHVRRSGEDTEPGRMLAAPGAVLTRPLAILSAAAGISHASVVPVPRVGILTTGDELVPVDAQLTPSAVRDVNGPLLANAVESMGILAVNLGRARDDVNQIADRLATPPALDAAIVSGGLGRGERDVVVDALARDGIVRAFQVAMRPGKPFAFGWVSGVPVFALPGNPGAALAAFHVLVAPCLRLLAGRAPYPPVMTARLGENVENRGGRHQLVRVRLYWEDSTLHAMPTRRSGSGLVSDLVTADALLCIPPSVESARAGEGFPIFPLKPLEG